MGILLRYVHVQRPDGTLKRAPFIPIYLHDKEGQKISVFALLDSGADNTLVPKKLAEHLGLQQQDELETSGIGGKVKVKTSKLHFSVMGKRERYALSFPALVLQEDINIPLLLGRNGFFENFHITFRQNEEKIVLKKTSAKRD